MMIIRMNVFLKSWENDMQTFVPYDDIRNIAHVLDDKRLGKQRVETIQIVRSLLGLTESSGWRNHPAVRMWSGYEPYLVCVYLRGIMDEWTSRGFKNGKCQAHYEELYDNMFQKQMLNGYHKPHWLIEKSGVPRSHRLMLCKKKPEHYLPLFDDVSRSDIESDDVGYVWPVTLRSE